MSEAADPDVGATFVQRVFTRPLKPGLRPLADAPFVPVDGAISRVGDIDDHRIIQAKGHNTTAQLLGGNTELAAHPSMGISPISTCRPRVITAAYAVRRSIGADDLRARSLFQNESVTARGVPGLFARNERLCVFARPRMGGS